MFNVRRCFYCKEIENYDSKTNTTLRQPFATNYEIKAAATPPRLFVKFVYLSAKRQKEKQMMNVVSYNNTKQNRKNIRIISVQTLFLKQTIAK